MITAHEVESTLALTPASQLNAESFCFAFPPDSNSHQPFTFKRGVPNPDFHYSLATVPQLQAELLKHGFSARTRERRPTLIAMYRKEVLKIEAEVGTEAKSNKVDSAHDASLSTDETRRRELVLPPKKSGSVYYGLTVMELRMILEPHPCVVWLLQKQELVALCDKYKPAFGESLVHCMCALNPNGG